MKDRRRHTSTNIVLITITCVLGYFILKPPRQISEVTVLSHEKEAPMPVETVRRAQVQPQAPSAMDVIQRDMNILKEREMNYIAPESVTSKHKQLYVEYCVSRDYFSNSVKPGLEREAQFYAGEDRLLAKQKMQEKTYEWWLGWYRRHDTMPAEIGWIGEMIESDPVLAEEIEKALSARITR